LAAIHTNRAESGSLGSSPARLDELPVDHIGDGPSHRPGGLAHVAATQPGPPQIYRDRGRSIVEVAVRDRNINAVVVMLIERKQVIA
jgi:hypothetical protein